MRLRFGAAMAPKGGRTAIIGVEVFEGRGPDGLLQHEFYVGACEWVRPFTVEAAKERIVDLMTRARSERPCVIIDVGTPQGLALHQSLRRAYPDELHRPHAYPGSGPRAALFSAFLQAYSAGRVTFAPDLPNRADLDRALIFFMGGGHKKGDIELDSEDEALVMALGLALTWPKHGPNARPLTAKETE